jgi:hypothetical protein
MILTKRDLMDRLKNYHDDTLIVIANHNEADYIQDVELYDVALSLESQSNNPYIMEHYILKEPNDENF